MGVRLPPCLPSTLTVKRYLGGCETPTANGDDVREHAKALEDEGVESIPCHGRVSQCESGLGRSLLAIATSSSKIQKERRKSECRNLL